MTWLGGIDLLHSCGGLADVPDVLKGSRGRKVKETKGSQEKGSRGGKGMEQGGATPVDQDHKISTAALFMRGGGFEGGSPVLGG